ncbi:hypothetical protein AYI68_g7819 [Smittium mucronatum]|uniref:Rrn7/TAF1B C-terminal cyclin domain-containing protein n=1 Tax=Smittium mucronatum TaxID=133383 RepID=A0A1R0GMP3_9FUNG|nr:hypothetical protein AYI68_g7819 [Smittium mucronatum]
MNPPTSSRPKKIKLGPCQNCGLNDWRRNNVGRLECPLGHEYHDVVKELWMLRLSDLNIERDYEDDIELHGDLANEISSTEDDSDEDLEGINTFSNDIPNESNILNDITKSIHKTANTENEQDFDQFELHLKYKMLNKEAKDKITEDLDSLNKDTINTGSSKKRKRLHQSLDTMEDGIELNNQAASGEDLDANSSDLVTDDFTSDYSDTNNARIPSDDHTFAPPPKKPFQRTINYKFLRKPRTRFAPPDLNRMKHYVGLMSRMYELKYEIRIPVGNTFLLTHSLVQRLKLPIQMITFVDQIISLSLHKQEKVSQKLSKLPKIRWNVNNEKYVAASLIVVLKLIYGFDGIFRNHPDSQYYLNIFGNENTRMPTFNEFMDFLRSDFYLQSVPSNFLTLTMIDDRMLNRYSDYLERLLLLEGTSFKVKTRKRFANHLNTTFSELHYFLKNENQNKEFSPMQRYLQQYLTDCWLTSNEAFLKEENASNTISTNSLDVDKDVCNKQINNSGFGDVSGTCIDSIYCLSSGLEKSTEFEFDSILSSGNRNHLNNGLGNVSVNDGSISNPKFPFKYLLNTTLSGSHQYVKIFDLVNTMSNYKESNQKSINGSKENVTDLNLGFDVDSTGSNIPDRFSDVQDTQYPFSQLGANFFSFTSDSNISTVPETEPVLGGDESTSKSAGTKEPVDRFFLLLQNYYDKVVKSYPKKLIPLEYYMRDYDSILNGLIKSSFHQHLGISILTDAQKSNLLDKKRGFLKNNAESKGGRDTDAQECNLLPENLLFSGDMIPVYLKMKAENGLSMGNFHRDYSNVLVYMADLCGVGARDLHDQVSTIESNLLKNQVEMRLRHEGPQNYIFESQTETNRVGNAFNGNAGDHNLKAGNFAHDLEKGLESFAAKLGPDPTGSSDALQPLQPSGEFATWRHRFSEKIDIVDINDEELAGRSFIKRRIRNGILMESSKFLKKINRSAATEPGSAAKPASSNHKQEFVHMGLDEFHGGLPRLDLKLDGIARRNYVQTSSFDVEM